VFKDSRNLVLRIEAELHERLIQLASERGTTVSELVRPLLERLVRGKTKGGKR
jgi:predicted DNA-binding protein